MEQGKNDMQPIQIMRDADGVASSTAEAKLSERRRGLPRVGFYFSGAYLFFLLAMAIVAWDKLFVLTPNEFGDMLAGAFAPLAFLWLVLGFFQQGEELQASVRALELQGEELRNSVEQQRELVKVNREQMETAIEAANSQRVAEEFAAQPVFVPANGRSFRGDSARFEIGFRNAGAKATNVILRSETTALSEQQVLNLGDTITSVMVFDHHKDIRDVTGYVEYYDARGNRRAKRYWYELEPATSTDGRNSLKDGKIDDTLFVPPFPWEHQNEG